MKYLKTFSLALLCLSALPGMANAQRLTGSDSGRPPVVMLDGPWLMEWSTSSEYPLLASIEIRLYDADSDEYLGMVAELKGTGSGAKLFENPGRYQFVIVGTFVDWDIRIEEVDEERAAAMKREAADRPSMLDTAREVSRLVPESSFESWRPDGNDTLLLFRDGVLSWTIGFSPACPGLESATALSFVMRSVERGTDQYDSILLESGQRCYFTSVVPGYMR
ncbi:MAG: hypothetical protein OEM63_05875 [Gammaproteobacteria bacterium]|nr:hypothetical protein [Gammaproteobacteria bacterium]